MKKNLICICLATMLLSTTVFGSSTIPVYFDSEPMKLSQKPVIENGTTLVPFRNIFEKIGFEVEWDSNTRTIKGHNELTEIELKLDSKIAYVNGEQKTLPVAPKLVGSTTMIPLRFVTETAGLNVNWDSDDRYITIGEVDQDLIDVYENSSKVYTSSGDIRLTDLSTTDGTGAYAGYKKLSGHPYGSVDIYYTSNSGNTNVSVVKKNYNPNEVITWKYNGVTYKNYKKDIFDLLDGTSSLSNYSGFLNGQNLHNIFGNTYQEWFDYGVATQDGARIVNAYVDYLDGSKFNTYYNKYKSTKASDVAYEKSKLEQQEKEEAAKLEQQKEDEYEVKYKAAMDTFNNEWISEDTLEHYYNISPTWMGETIWVKNSNTGKELTIKGSPSSSFEEGKVYFGSGIHYKRVKEVEVPFAEAKDGSGKIVLDVNAIVYSVKDLQEAGILGELTWGK